MMLKYHKNLTIERWRELTMAEQMAHVGSEVFRSLSWREKGDEIASWQAFERSLELLDLTKQSLLTEGHRLKEVCRAREAWVDYFYGDNVYGSTKEQWEQYFYQFTYLARNIKH